LRGEALNVSYDVPSGGSHVSIGIYDAAGRLVRTLVDESRPAGNFTIEWNGRDQRGRAVASGIYFYRMTAGSFNDTKKMVLLK
jgi:flagellar hook assembly protein FlgD